MTDDNRTWEEILAIIVPEVLNDFYNPLVSGIIRLEDKLESGTAHQDFITNETAMSREFLDKLYNHGEIEKETITRGIYKHELGHYLIYPHDCSKLMFLRHFAKGQFKEFKEEVVAYWVDIMDNLPQILKQEHGRDVRHLYKAMNVLLEKELILSDEQKKKLEAKGLNPADIIKIHHTYSVDRLLTAYYQVQSGEDLGVDIRGEYLEDKLKELMTLKFLDDENEVNKKSEIINFVQFGAIISEVLQKLKDELPEELKEKDGSKDEAEVGKTLMGPMIGDTPSFLDFTDEQIEEGLDKMIQEFGKKRYELIRELVEKETGKTFDRKIKNGLDSLIHKNAGLEKSELEFFDEQIPYYKRFASTYGLYVYTKPMVVDVLNSYPEGQIEFRIGDKIHRLNPFSTGGKLYPGITKKNVLKTGKKKDKQFRVPDLSVWIDSSGSMSNPANDSYAVKCAYILGRNYHANGSLVGGANFSAETAFLQPSRNLDLFYSLMTAYWGGGTVLNISKIKEYMEHIADERNSRMPIYTTEQDYEDLIKHMHPEEQKKYVDKHLSVNLTATTRQTYERMDNVLITDGGIFNLEELIEYFNTTASITRNTVFLIGNAGQYKEWDEIHFPNTQIIPVDNAEDLMGLSIGVVKKILPKDEKPTSLFYK